MADLNAPAPRRRQRKVGAGVATMLLVTLFWVVSQGTMCVTRYDNEMGEAARAMGARDWAGARDHFREAATARMFDDDAIFGLHTAEMLEAGEGLNPFELAVSRGDLEAARVAAKNAETDALRERQLKLLDALTTKAE